MYDRSACLQSSYSGDSMFTADFKSLTAMRCFASDNCCAMCCVSTGGLPWGRSGDWRFEWWGMGVLEGLWIGLVEGFMG